MNRGFANTAHIEIKKDIKKQKGSRGDLEYLVTEERPKDSIGPKKVRFVATVKKGKPSYKLVPPKSN